MKHLTRRKYGGNRKMTVKEYLINNPDKAAYTIKKGRKSYLCNLFECVQFFGNASIKKIGYRENFDNTPCKGLPILYLS